MSNVYKKRVEQRRHIRELHASGVPVTEIVRRFPFMTPRRLCLRAQP